MKWISMKKVMALESGTAAMSGSSMPSTLCGFGRSALPVKYGFSNSVNLEKPFSS